MASPAAIVQRQRHFRVRCRAALEFEPRQANEEAGLTVRASDAFHFDVGVRNNAGAREAVLSTRIAGASAIVGRVPLPDGPVMLEVSATETSYTFTVGAAGAAATQVLGVLPTRTLAAEEIGKHGKNHFTGAMIGLYATGTAAPRPCPPTSTGSNTRRDPRGAGGARQRLRCANLWSIQSTASGMSCASWKLRSSP